MGGLYFSFDVTFCQISVWIIASLYISFYDGGSSKLSASTIYSFLGALLALWLATAFLFFYKIKRKYWSTFYSLETGGQTARAFFLENDDDEKKIAIFKRSPVLWKSIEGQVKAWTLAKWSEWEEQKPQWFTEAFKERVPDEMIPKSALYKLHKKAKGGQRKRSSAALVSAK